MATDSPQSLRILAVSSLRHGTNDYAFVRAFRRAEHSVRVVSASDFLPSWHSKSLRLLRRYLRGALVREYNASLVAAAEQFEPDMFFVFKGPYVTAETLQAFKLRGIVCIQFYPDTSFGAHSPYLTPAIPHYDWFFSTKPDHVERLRATLGMKNVSFLPHAFDPETHVSLSLSERDRKKYGCDVAFVGNVSHKKHELLRHLCEALSGVDIRIWGAPAWAECNSIAASSYQGAAVWGLEYAKVINAARINLGLLFEGGGDGAAPDTVTARTFELPASGGFMLHERTNEALHYFDEDKDCAYFSGRRELIEKTRYFLEHADERRRMARAGQHRCFSSGYSVDHHVSLIIEKFHKLRAERAGHELLQVRQ